MGIRHFRLRLLGASAYATQKYKTLQREPKSFDENRRGVNAQKQNEEERRKEKNKQRSGNGSSWNAMLNVTYFGNCVCYYIWKPQTQLAAAVSSGRESVTATLRLRCCYMYRHYRAPLTENPIYSNILFYFIYLYSFLGVFSALTRRCVFVYAFSAHQFAVYRRRKRRAEERKRTTSRSAGSGQK